MDGFSCDLVSGGRDLAGAFNVRRQVFVVEQNIPPALVFDELDNEALHVVARQGIEIIGSARARLLNVRQAKIERMAVLRHFRGRGVGTSITSFIIGELKSRKVERVFLHAQCEVAAFYRVCGFEKIGLSFLEAGIKHIRMQKEL